MVYGHLNSIQNYFFGLKQRAPEIPVRHENQKDYGLDCLHSCKGFQTHCSGRFTEGHSAPKLTGTKQDQQIMQTHLTLLFCECSEHHCHSPPESTQSSLTRALFIFLQLHSFCFSDSPASQKTPCIQLSSKFGGKSAISNLVWEKSNLRGVSFNEHTRTFLLSNCMLIDSCLTSFLSTVFPNIPVIQVRKALLDLPVC